MKKFKIIFFITAIFLNGCGYTPIYVQNDDFNFSIKLSEVKGDTLINKFISSNLKQYQLSKNEKEYFLSINSKYSKEAVSKDLTGKVKEYKLIAYAEFLILSGENEKRVVLKETSLMKTLDDMIDEKSQERNLIQSLASVITEKLILELTNIK